MSFQQRINVCFHRDCELEHNVNRWRVYALPEVVFGRCSIYYRESSKLVSVKAQLTVMRKNMGSVAQCYCAGVSVFDSINWVTIGKIKHA